VTEDDFPQYSGDEDTDVVTVWLNDEERAMLESIKDHYGMDRDSTALKAAAFPPNRPKKYDRG